MSDIVERLELLYLGIHETPLSYAEEVCKEAADLIAGQRVIIQNQDKEIERQRAVIKAVLEEAYEWIEDLLDRDEWVGTNGMAREIELLIKPLNTLDGGGDDE